MQCQDGSTVWYGRSKSWFRAFGTVVAALNAVNPWGWFLIPLSAAADSWGKTRYEEFSHWPGYVPTTGVECERVDIVKFPVGGVGNADSYTPLMLADRSWLGRITLNDLKPYDINRQQKAGFVATDVRAYADGCKTVKGAGTKGKWEQLKSVFKDLCSSAVTRGAFVCSTHSRLCGSSGGVAKLLPVYDWESCQNMKGPTGMQSHSRCPIPSDL